MADNPENNIPAGDSPAPETAAAPAAPSSAPRGEGRGSRFGGGNRGGQRGPRRPRPGENTEGGGPGSELTEKVVYINRNAKVVKGGRRFSFSALIVVGDHKGRIGLGLGKAAEVADAIRKGGEAAKASMVSVSLNGATLPHEVTARYCGAIVLLRPASPGTGVIAGKTVRAVLESVGVKDVLSKCLGSNNPANVVKATISALQQMRLREDIFKGRGIPLKTEKAAEPVIPA